MFRPRVTFGTIPTVWRPEFPPALWTEEEDTVGGSGIAAGGAMSGYVVREDRLLVVPFRFMAEDWATLQALLAWAFTGATFTFEPDPDERPDVVLTVNLHAPRAGERVRPATDPQYPRLRVLELTLRRADGEPFLLDYFEPGNWPAEGS